MRFFLSLSVFSFFCLTLLSLAPHSLATDTAQPEKTTVQPQQESPSETSSNAANTAAIALPEEEERDYKDLTLYNLAHLYWKINMLSLDNNEHLDNFVRLTNCDIFTDYFQNEFEWKGVRKAVREYLEANKDTFPLRLQFTQPLKLGNYNLQSGKFEVQDEYKINGVRRFEAISASVYDKVCGSQINIPGYPKGMVIELNRPFAMVDFPVSEDIAKEYIARKQEEFRTLSPSVQNKDKLHEIRNVYMVMKVKIFSGKEREKKNMDGMAMASVMGILEGIEIYGDMDQTMLMYEKDYIKERRMSQMERRLRSEHKKRQEEELRKLQESREKRRRENQTGEPDSQQPQQDESR